MKYFKLSDNDDNAYTVFMQDTQPSQDGLWIKGRKKDFRFTYGLPIISVGFAKTLPDVTTPFSDEGCSVVVDDKIYIFANSCIWCFSPETHTFSNGISISSSSGVPSCVYLNGKIYIFGIDDASYGAYEKYRAIYQFDPVTNEKAKNSATLPASLFGTSAVAIDNYAYIFGGTDSNIILKFDPSSNTVTELATTLPNKMSGTSAVVYDGKAYILGGKDNNIYFSSILEFDPVEETIKQVGCLSEERSYMSATLVGNTVYLFGGYSNTTAFDTISKFNCVTKEVANLGVTLPYNEFQGASSAVNGHSYIFSGYSWGHSTEIRTVVDFVDGKPLTFDGYYIDIENTGTPTKISAHEIQNVSNVFSGTNFDDTVKAYSVVDGIAIEL